MGVLPTAAPPTSPCTVLDVGTASPSCGGLEGSALGTGVPGRFLEQMAFYPGPEGRADGGLALVGRRGLMERPGRPIILPRPGHQPRRGGLWSTAQAGGNRRVGPSRWSGCHSPVRGSRDHWRPGRSTHPISHELCETSHGLSSLLTCRMGLGAPGSHGRCSASSRGVARSLWKIPVEHHGWGERPVPPAILLGDSPALEPSPVQ
ncbi:PREDICTED: uncharacterized protein LOC105816424 isoform X1 [Propithecus coquereli]|uniref:uncharacterized protein LOC105816424 isoform X1 n=1 Tax=Propithecus coquereli TaxID=379532 RepID=UPI00063F4989|nr:PREDICTED: uncharacterized protein LOC105816424 isoform X1 [Propithecus coquereli]